MPGWPPSALPVDGWETAGGSSSNREGSAMSHFTKVQTKITDIECLKQALEDLQYTLPRG